MIAQSNRSLTAYGFPANCGITLITNVNSYFDPTTWWHHPFQSKEEFNRELKRVTKDLRYGLEIITMNEEQKNRLEDWLLSNKGWTRVAADVYNPNSGNKIYVYMKVRQHRNKKHNTGKLGSV